MLRWFLLQRGVKFSSLLAQILPSVLLSPGNGAFGPQSALCQLLDLQDPLGLDLVQRLPARQPDVEHPFGVSDPEPSPLTSGQEQNRDPTPGDLQES